MAMTDEELDAFISRCVENLQVKNEHLRTAYGLGTFKRWFFSQQTGLLQFSDERGHVKMEAVYTYIGSFSTKSNTWQWGWANVSILEPLREKSAKLKELSQITGAPVFETPGFAGDEAMAWELSAMAVEHLGALGCYRAPSDHLYIFMAIVSLQPVGFA